MKKIEPPQKQLTKAEEQIMQVIWKLDKAFLREIVEVLPEPKPHQNTVATILKILIEKEFVAIEVIGRNHQYFPLITKEAYSKGTLQQVAKGYFEGSFSNMVSFFVKEENISIKELEQMLEQTEKSQKRLIFKINEHACLSVLLP